MKTTNESILSSIIRSFLSSFFSIVGMFLALLVMIVLIGLFFTGNLTHKDGNLLTTLPNENNRRDPLNLAAPSILVIDIKEIIGSPLLTFEKVNNQLIASKEGALERTQIKAIFLQIDSTGGFITDTDNIYRALIEYKTKYNIPIYAYINGYCASGAYYIASAADKIYATPTSLIGSVGVISIFLNASEALNKLGIKCLTLSAGKNKDNLSFTRPWAENEGEHYQQITDFYYKQFIDVVTKARPNLDKNLLIEKYGALIYPAPQAKDYGYIDVDTASRNQVVRELRQELHLEEDQYQLIQITAKSSLTDLIKTAPGLIQNKLNPLPLRFDTSHLNKFLYLYQSN